MKRALLAGAVAACALAATLWSRRTPPPPPALAQPFGTPAQVLPAGGQPPEVAPPEPLCRFNAGQVLAYDVSLKTSMTLSEQLGGYTTGQPAPEQTSSARLHLEVLRVETSSAVLLARLSNLEGTLSHVEAEGVDYAFLARVTERCEVQGFARHRTTPRPSGRVQQGVLSELSFRLPSGPAPEQVTVETAMGRASALIFAAGDRPHTFVRALQQFESTWSAGMNGVTIDRSRTEIRRGQGPWFDELEGVDAYSTPGVLTKGSSAIKVTAVAPEPSFLASTSHVEEDYLWESCFTELPSARMRPIVPPGHAERVRAMQNVTFASAIENMLVKFEVTTDLTEQTRDMSAYLDAHPENIPQFGGALLEEFEPEWKMAGFLALGKTQNAAARELLLEVFRDRSLQPIDRIRSSLALVTRRDVGLPLAKELMAEARSSGSSVQKHIAQQALLHAGVLAGMHSDDEAVVLEVRNGLKGELGRPSPLERAAVYSAIGNTGDLAFLSDLELASRNPDPEWRRIVPIGMSRMPVEAVRAFTLEWLRRETSPDVMRELFEVMQHQYAAAGKSIDDELAAEAVRYLRMQPRMLTRQSILQLLEHHVSINDDVRAAFREQLKLEYEANSGMFAYIASCLSQDDVQAVLATIPSLADQHRGGAPAPRPAPSPSAPVVPAGTVPPEMMPKMNLTETP